MIYKSFVKPLLDRILAFVFVILFWWLYIVLAILVRVNLGSPVLFIQVRPGRIDPKSGKEVIFKLYKFRTMTSSCDIEGRLLPDEERMTKFGRFLRASSLDELPEILFNILLASPKKAMSWIGPRPLLVKYLSLYTEEQRRRHEVSPGLTGYAQVQGRNSLSWEEKFKLDTWYVDHISFALDCKILADTVITVLKREGISAKGEATMSEFKGQGH